MDVKVLGTGCAKCKLLFAEAQKAVTAAGLPAALGKVEQIDEIMKFGVMMTPALVVDGEVKCAGRIPQAAEIVTWLMNAAAQHG